MACMPSNIRVSPKLTLNIGLRYEFVTTPYVLHGRISNLHAYSTPGQSLATLTLGNPVFQNPSLHNFAPRFGFPGILSATERLPSGAVGEFSTTRSCPAPSCFLMTRRPRSMPTPTFSRPPTRSSRTPSFPSKTSWWEIRRSKPLQFSMQQPTVYKYSFGIQREIARNTTVEAGFDGVRGVHLVRVIMSNMPVAQNVAANLHSSTAPLDPALGRNRPKQSDGTSTYYAGRLQVNERISRGFQWQP